MTRGRETKYAARGVKQYPVPKREQFLDHDFFYECRRCGDPWPKHKLKREPITQLLVCPNDYDVPSVVDTRDNDRAQRRDRFDRLGHNLEEIY